jgi:type IX secretion system substrate protein
MKKFNQKLLICCLAILFAFTSKAQTTCSTSVTYTYPVTQTITSYSNSNYWFTITTPGSGAYQLTVTNGSGGGKITKALAYTGACASLTLFAADSLVDTTRTSFNINLFNTASTTYYINLSNPHATAITFSLTTVRQLYILGQLSYPQGSADTLFDGIIGGSGTPSYTWQPGGAHTSQIISTATVNTTYTLTYSDGIGTLTDTATARPWTPPPPMDCQLVVDWNLENMGNPANSISNIGDVPGLSCLPSGFYANSNVLSNWLSPTCGTPDYYNSSFGTGSQVGVPYNMYSPTPLYPHSGNGYAGFYIYDGGVNWREYIEGPLTCSLVTGQVYNVSYWVSMSPNTVLADVASNYIGAYLSNSLISSSTTGPLSYVPQINASTAINNAGTWTQVSGTIVGSGQQYITVGNFYNDVLTSPYPSIGDAYYFVDDISVTPASPTITISSCQSGSVTLTATGAASANVSWYDGTSYYSGSPLLYPSPSSAVTITCTVTFPGCGVCPNETATVTINPAPACSGTNPTYAPAVNYGNYTFNPSQGYAASNITVNSGVNYIINCPDMRFAAGTSITVTSGGTLTIAGSWLHACNTCTNTSMWQGIIVDNGGQLLIEQFSGRPAYYNIIEDAVQAVYTQNNSSATPIPTWTITDVIFNNNATDIYIDSHQGNLSGNVINSDCIFTCRNLSNHSVIYSNFGAIRSDILAATPTLYPSTTNPTDLTIAGLRTKYGIYINAVNIAYPINVGGNTNTYTSCIFDNLDYGIYAYESSLTAIGNTFQNLTGNSTDKIGAGIYSDATNGTNTGVAATLIVGNSSTTIVSGEANTFTNCLAGVYTINMRQAYINNNSFNNEITATTYNTTGTHVTGGYGIVQTGFAASASTSAETLQVANNSIQNCANGNFLTFKKLYNTNANTYSSSSANSMNIQGNTITATGANYCTYGLYFNQSNAGANSGVPQDALSVTTNTITNVATNAIYALNVDNSSSKGFMQIYNNGELSVKYNPACTTLTSPRTAAINLSGCYQTRVTYNTNIRTTGFSGTSVPSVQYIGGIYTDGSTSNTINCNTVSNTGEDFVFEGTCTSGSGWLNNSMDYSKYGLVLRGVGSTNGSMGDQGNATDPVNNSGSPSWAASAHFTDETLADGANPGTVGSSSKLYTLATACTYSPCTNSYNGSPTPYGATTLLTATGSNSLTCGSVNGDRLAGNNNQVADNSGADSLYYQALQNSLNADTTNAYPNSRWDMQYLISSALPSLTPVANCTHAKTLALADAAFNGGDYSTALSLSNSFNASNTIESNWQTVTPVLIKAQSYTLNSSDISTLQSVASQCPHNGGRIVWTARALLDEYYRMPLSYPNDCAMGGGDRVQNTTGAQQLTVNKKQNVNLYPNPNNGSMSVEYKVSKDAYLEITDINGNLVGKYNLPALGTKIDIRNDNLNNGVYLYRVINDVVVSTGKVVIMK